MKLSIIVPVYNELNRIELAIKEIVAANLPDQKEIIVINDGSTDGTKEKLENITNIYPIKIIHHQQNIGKGAAVRTGFTHATGDIILIQDADLEYSPDDYPKLLAPILGDKADVVYGSRFIGGEAHRVLYFWNYIANRFLTSLSNIFTNFNLTDMEVCFKVFRREILNKITLKQNRFGFEPEFTAKIAKIGCRVYEVPVSYHGRSYKDGKKISWKDAFVAMWCIIRYGIFN